MTIKYYTSDNTETTDKDAAAYVIFEIIGSGTETRYIDVVTELTNPDVYGVNKRTTIYNYATITTDSVYGTNRNLPSDVEVNATASYTSKMLEKTLVSYNYETKTASWKIIVNHNETALTGVELTDDMPTGLTLDTSSVMLGETSLADDGRNLSTEKQLRIARYGLLKRLRKHGLL